MFANFFGIVIISASVLLIAGLVLRPDPNLPATMNLGLVDKLTESAQQTTSTGSEATDDNSHSNSETATSSNSDASGTDSSDGADSSAPTSTDSISTETTASNSDSSSAPDASSDSSSNATDSASSTEETSPDNKATESPTYKTVEDKAGSDSNKAPAAPTHNFSKQYLERKRRALQERDSAHTRTNKSDAAKYKD